jgi:hypothetical protein
LFSLLSLPVLAECFRNKSSRATDMSAEIVTGKDLDGKRVSLTKTTPQQMDFFQMFVEHPERYSNTIDLYDAAPKYFASPKEMNALREKGTYLPTLKRLFRYRAPQTNDYHEYTISVRPGRVERDGRDIECYPTEREEIIEEALRKIATQKLKGCYLDGMVGVQFTLYELRKELKDQGHEMHLNSIIEGLTVCNRVNLTIKSPDGKSLLSSAIFPTLIVTSRADWLENPETAKCYVQFNALVTNSIKSLTFRQHDYTKWMGYDRHLTRWLHKRLWNNFTYANWNNHSYHLRATTIIRDSGLINAKQFRDCVRTIDEAAEELIKNRIIREFNKKVEIKGRRIVEVVYVFYATHEFVDEMKKANQRSALIEESSHHRIQHVEGTAA